MWIQIKRIQQNETTKARQLDLWAEILAGYCKTYRIFKFDLSKLDKVSSSTGGRTAATPPHLPNIHCVEQIFVNPTINSKLAQVSFTFRPMSQENNDIPSFS